MVRALDKAMLTLPSLYKTGSHLPFLPFECRSSQTLTRQFPANGH